MLLIMLSINSLINATKLMRYNKQYEQFSAKKITTIFPKPNHFTNKNSDAFNFYHQRNNKNNK